MENFIFKKSYGQNFLNDDNIVKNIVDGAMIKEHSLVIEIGPGSGALTKILAAKAQNVLCYEIDDRLEEILDENLLNYHNVDIIFDDFLNRNIVKDIEKYNYDNVYIVANLPYYITTPIIEKIIASRVDFVSVTVMIQKEVGDRFCARVGTRDYSSITVFLNYFYDIKKLFVVSRNCFTPKPNVDSIVISLITKKERQKALNEELFFRIVRDSFRFKRKNLRNNLKEYNLSKIDSVLKEYNFDLTVRAEQLSLQIFIDMADELANN